MRQVPTYLIIGNGRVARHFRHYLSSLSIVNFFWDRRQDQALLAPLLERASHVLLLVSDNAIEQLAQGLETRAMKIHFSGALVTPHAFGAHPLMTFGSDLYAPEKYKGITFVTDKGAPDFSALLPGLSNPHAELDPALKARYHALCVMAGNFSCLLWQKLFDDFAGTMGLPSETAHPYLSQQAENLIRDYKTALTGPLARGDEATIARNLAALDGDPFQKIYRDFVAVYRERGT